jgi:potassium/hydrogen antiporter
MPTIEEVILVASVLLLLGVLASKVSVRAGIPPLLLFLALGMLAGSDGPGGIFFDNAWLAQLVGTVALAFILFSGGLDTDWPKVRSALWPALSLSTVGVLITAVLVAAFAMFALGFSWLEGLLLGAVVSATDAAAVFSVVGTGALRVRERLLAMLELESGTNDPMAVFLTIGITSLLIGESAGAASLIPLFVTQMGIGAALGFALGWGTVQLMNRLKLDAAGLNIVLTTALVLFTYGLTASLHGSGFLAVYIAGLVVGNGRPADLPAVARFHTGLTALMETAMFLTLGLLVFPSHLLPVAGAGLLVTLVLTFVARPVSVFASLAPARMGVRERAFVSWVGLRGAVPIILATFPLLAGVPRAGEIFDIVFFTVLASVLLQGTTIPFVAHRLGVVAETSP